MRIPGKKTVQQSIRWLRSRLVPGVLILGYHRVDDVVCDPHSLCVSPKHFSEQLDVLSRVAQPISLKELINGLTENELPRRAVVLTMDDGYADIWYQAWPILEQYKIPATLFVSSGFLDRQFSWDIQEPTGSQHVRNGMNIGRALTSGELINIASTGLVEIGSHSVNHPQLAARPVSEQLFEIQMSKRQLEDLLNQPVVSFSYPHGSASDVTIDLVRENGYRCGCASFNDVVQRYSNPFHLPRFWIEDWDGDKFYDWIRWWLK
jgi:peptidoglycan/xylan/chitin deacetylase (PgdA/CDA1 family)